MRTNKSHQQSKKHMHPNNLEDLEPSFTQKMNNIQHFYHHQKQFKRGASEFEKFDAKETNGQSDRMSCQEKTFGNCFCVEYENKHLPLCGERICKQLSKFVMDYHNEVHRQICKSNGESELYSKYLSELKKLQEKKNQIYQRYEDNREGHPEEDPKRSEILCMKQLQKYLENNNIFSNIQQILSKMDLGAAIITYMNDKKELLHQLLEYDMPDTKAQFTYRQKKFHSLKKIRNQTHMEKQIIEKALNNIKRQLLKHKNIKLIVLNLHTVLSMCAKCQEDVESFRKQNQKNGIIFRVRQSHNFKHYSSKQDGKKQITKRLVYMNVKIDYDIILSPSNIFFSQGLYGAKYQNKYQMVQNMFKKLKHSQIYFIENKSEKSKFQSAEIQKKLYAFYKNKKFKYKSIDLANEKSAQTPIQLKEMVDYVLINKQQIYLLSLKIHQFNYSAMSISVEQSNKILIRHYNIHSFSSIINPYISVLIEIFEFLARQQKCQLIVENLENYKQNLLKDKQEQQIFFNLTLFFKYRDEDIKYLADPETQKQHRNQIDQKLKQIKSQSRNIEVIQPNQNQENEITIKTIQRSSVTHLSINDSFHGSVNATLASLAQKTSETPTYNFKNQIIQPSNEDELLVQNTSQNSVSISQNVKNSELIHHLKTNTFDENTSLGTITQERKPQDQYILDLKNYKDTEEIYAKQLHQLRIQNQKLKLKSLKFENICEKIRKETLKSQQKNVSHQDQKQHFRNIYNLASKITEQSNNLQEKSSNFQINNQNLSKNRQNEIEILKQRIEQLESENKQIKTQNSKLIESRVQFSKRQILDLQKFLKDNLFVSQKQKQKQIIAKNNSQLILQFSKESKFEMFKKLRVAEICIEFQNKNKICIQQLIDRNNALLHYAKVKENEIDYLKDQLNDLAVPLHRRE